VNLWLFDPTSELLSFTPNICYAEMGDEVVVTDFKLLLRHSPKATAMESETPTYFQNAYKLEHELHIRLRNSYSLNNRTKKETLNNATIPNITTIA
jgi:hypothetical protein